MALHIEFNDEIGQTIYAALFDSKNKKSAFNVLTNSFLTFSLEAQSSFAIPLTEDPIRVGFYSNVIANTSNLVASPEDQWYLVEVYNRQGDAPDRTVDKLVGSKAFYWDGKQEVDLSCSSFTNTVNNINITLEELKSILHRPAVLPDAQIPRISPGKGPASTGGISFS